MKDCEQGSPGAVATDEYLEGNRLKICSTAYYTAAVREGTDSEPSVFPPYPSYHTRQLKHDACQLCSVIFAS